MFVGAGGVGGGGSVPRVDSARGEALTEVHESGSTALNEYAKIIEGSVQTARLSAIRALAAFNSPESVSHLTNMLNNGEPVVRTEASRALGSIGDRDSTDALQQLLLTDENLEVRETAFSALRRIHGDDAFFDLLTNNPAFAEVRSELSFLQQFIDQQQSIRLARLNAADVPETRMEEVSYTDSFSVPPGGRIRLNLYLGEISQRSAIEVDLVAEDGQLELVYNSQRLPLSETQYSVGINLQFRDNVAYVVPGDDGYAHLILDINGDQVRLLNPGGRCVSMEGLPDGVAIHTLSLIHI
jgi:hypothetical protein